MQRPTSVFERMVLDRNRRNTTPKVSLPRWWVGNCERVRLEVYSDRLVIKKDERG